MKPALAASTLLFAAALMSALAAQQKSVDSVSTEVLAVENARTNALDRNDVAALDKILGDDLTSGTVLIARKGISHRHCVVRIVDRLRCTRRFGQHESPHVQGQRHDFLVVHQEIPSSSRIGDRTTIRTPLRRLSKASRTPDSSESRSLTPGDSNVPAAIVSFSNSPTPLFAFPQVVSRSVAARLGSRIGSAGRPCLARFNDSTKPIACDCSSRFLDERGWRGAYGREGGVEAGGVCDRAL